MNEPMAHAMEASVADYIYPETMQHQVLPQFDHQMSDTQIQTQRATYGGYDDMHTWSAYVSGHVDFTVASPGLLELSENPMVRALSHREWPSSLEDGTREPTEEMRANGAGFETSVMGAPADDNYQLCGHYSDQQFYPFRALRPAPAFPASTWFQHSDENPAIHAQQPWDPTPRAENYQQPAVNTQETVQTLSPPMPRGKRDKAHDDDNDGPQSPLPKKRGRPRKVKKAALPPVITTPMMPAGQELQPSQLSTSLALWTSQSSPTSYQLSSRNGSTSSFSSDLLSCEVKVEQQHNTPCWNQNEAYHASPQLTETPTLIQSGSSIPGSPSTTSPFPIRAPYQQQQQQSPTYPVAPPQAGFCSATSSMTGIAGSQLSQQIPMPVPPTMDSQHYPFPTRQSSTTSLHMAHDLRLLGSRALAKDQKSRNRVAATKCRLKTKAATTALEEEEKVESERNYVLSDMAARLREEYFILRNQLLMHTNCKCTLIHQYLEKQAKTLAETGNCYLSMTQARNGSSPGTAMAIDDNDDGAGSGDAEGEEWDAKTMVEAKKEEEPAAEAEEEILQTKKKRRVGRLKKGSVSASAPSPVVAAAPPSSPPVATALGNLVHVREKVARRRLRKAHPLGAGMTPQSGQRVADLVR